VYALPLTLEEAVKMAIKNSDESKVSDVQHGQLKTATFAATNVFLPSVGFSYSKSLTPAYAQSPGFVRFGGADTVSYFVDDYRLGISQDLSLYKNIPKFSASLIEVRIGYLNNLIKNDDLINKSIATFLDLIYAKKALKLQSKVQKLSTQRMKMQEIYSENKLVTSYDVEKSTSDLLESLSLTEKFEADLTKLNYDLKALLKAEDDLVLKMPKVLERKNFPVADVEDFIRQVLEYNYRIRIAKHQKEKASLDQKISYLELLPDVKLSYARSRNALSFLSGSFVTSDVFTLDLNVPIFDQGRSYAKIAQTTSESKISQYRYHIATDQMTSEARRVWTTYSSLDNIVNARAKAVDFTKSRFESAKQMFDIGQKSEMELLAAEVEYDRAKLALVKSNIDKIKAYYQIMSMLALNPFIVDK
jgi:outer membrane protein TolC